MGLALDGTGTGTVIDLMPKRKRRGGDAMAGVRGRLNPKIVAAVAAGVVLLGGATYYAHSNASSAKSKKVAAQTEVQKIRNQIGHLEQAAAPTGASGSLQVQAATVLGTDVAWTNVFTDLQHALPAGVWLTTFSSTYALPPTASTSTSSSSSSSGTTSSSGSTATSSSGSAAVPGAVGASGCAAYEKPLSSTITMNGIAKDVPSIAAFIDNVSKIGGDKNPVLSAVWLASATKAQFGDTDVLTFTLNATLAPGARSDRLTTFFKGALCSK